MSSQSCLACAGVVARSVLTYVSNGQLGRALILLPDSTRLHISTCSSAPRGRGRRKAVSTGSAMAAVSTGSAIQAVSSGVGEAVSARRRAPSRGTHALAHSTAKTVWTT
eukprot:644741-Rhodomonas_salina.5